VTPGRAVLAVALLAAAAAVVFAQGVLAGELLVGITNFDLFAEFLPRHAFAGAALRRGVLPLWDPHQIAGLPFLATLQGGVLYPPNLLYALLPVGLAMGLLGFFHLVLTGAGAWAFCREQGSSPEGSALGAVSFMLGGASLFSLYHPNAIAALPWLPIALALVARLARTGDPRLAPVLGACLALQFLAGRDYLFVITVHAVGAFGLWEAARLFRGPGGGRAALRHGAALALAGLVAAGLAAPQWLPTLELAAQSTRSLAGPERASLEIFGPLSPEFVVANLVNPVRGPIRREYLGWLPLLCFAAGFRLWGRDRAAVFASLLAVVALALCFGSQTPLYAAYRHLPLASVFRLPDRFLTLFALAIALGAARGFDRLLPAAAPGARARAFTPAMVAALGLAVGLGLALSSGWLARGLAAAARPWGWFWLYGVSLEHFAGLPWAGAHLVAALAVLGLAAWRAGGRGERAARWAVVALAAVELAFAFEGPFLHPARAAEPAFGGRDCYAQAAPLLGAHGRHLTLSLPDSFALKDKDGELYGSYSATHYDPLVTRRQAAYFAALEAGGAPRYPSAWNQTGPFMGFLTSVPRPDRRRLLDLLGVRAVLLGARPSDRSPATQAFAAGFSPAARCLVPAARGSAPVEILANPHALPRAFLVAELAPAADAEDALRQLLAPDFDPRRRAVVEGAPPLAGAAGGEASPPGEAEIALYEDERVVVRTRSQAPGLLVLTDSYDPDWVATRNGERAPILATDALFRGVWLPAGDWEVEFRYRPRAFRLGAAIAAVSLAGTGLFLWHLRRRLPAQGDTMPSSSIS
jgi:hypothetical protein